MNFDTPDIAPGTSQIGQSWKQINEARSGARLLDGHRRFHLERITERRRPATMASEPMFPFRVYLAQLAYPAESNNPTADKTKWWRTFLVRGAYVGPSELLGSGCDGYSDDAFSDYIPQEDNNEDGGDPLVPFTVPSGVKWQVWIEWTQAGPILRAGSDLTTATTDGLNNHIKNPWTTAPDPDGLHHLIAQIDTQTNAGTFGPALITQFLTAHIPDGILITACDVTGADVSMRVPFAFVDNPPK